MPYSWTPSTPNEPDRFRLWPHRSLPATGFVWFIGLTAALLSIPLFAVLGSVVLWARLPFMAAAVTGIWWTLRRNYRDGDILEVLTLDRDRARLARRNPDGSEQIWEANSHWVRVTVYPT